MSSSPPVIKLDLTRQKLLVHPDDPLPVFYPPPRAVMVVPIYDTREAYATRSWTPRDDERRGYRRDSPPPSERSDRRGVDDYSDNDDRGSYGGRSEHGYRSSRHDPYEPRNGYRPHESRDVQNDRRGDYGRRDARSEPRGRYNDQSSEADISSDGQYGRPADKSRSRPVGQGPAHPLGAGHTNTSAQGNPTSAYAQQPSHQQAPSSNTHGRLRKPKPGAPGTAASQGYGHGASQGIAQSQSQGGQQGYPTSGYAQQPSQQQAPSSNTHGRKPKPGVPGTAASQGYGHGASQGNAQSQSQGGQQNATDPFQNIHLPPATRALLKYAREKGILDDLGQYFKILPPSPKFMYSKCTGRKKAVCVGINYVGQSDELKGCANDARNMRDFLIRNYGFQSQNILLLTDDDHSRGQPRPTRDEMFNAMSWLINGANAHDSLFFHYSGHGGQSPDASGQETDGMDEVIFPVDYDQGAGDIIDDELHEALVSKLAPGVRLTAVFDSCHSGTVLDLPYLHSAHGRLRSIGHITMRAKQRGVGDSGDVICFAACSDDEKSTDTREGGVAVGAMSWCFIQALEQDRNMTYEQLLQHLRASLIPKYHQKAQISGTHPLDLDRQFTL